VTAIPSAGNITSDAARPSLLWSWSASYPSHLLAPLPSPVGCPDGEYELYLPLQPQLRNAKLRYDFAGRATAVELDGAGPNPVGLELNRGLLNWSGHQELRARLQAEIGGEIRLSYSYRKREYRKHCSIVGGFEACGCEEETVFGTRQYAKAVGSGRDFSVEIGPVEALWINPPLQKRLAGAQVCEIALFARRMPSNVSIASGTREIASNQPYKFIVSEGGCKESLVDAVYAPQEKGLKLTASNASLEVRQLSMLNASYLPFSAVFLWNESAGAREVDVSFEDWFSGRQDFLRNFSVRRPSAFEAGGSALEIRRGSESESPAAGFPSAKEFDFQGLPQAAALAALVVALASMRNFISMPEGG